MFASSLAMVCRKTAMISFTLITSIAMAQSSSNAVCQEIVTEALRSANEACSTTSRNHVCYGNIHNVATPAAGVTDLRFEQVGDQESLSKIASLQLSPLNETEDQWGIVLMQIQANLPDTLPGQNVTFLLFGDVVFRPVSPVAENADGTGEVSSVIRPTQAFYFRSGIGRQTCAHAPVDGMIVQTPEGIGTVKFTLNGVDISLGSTMVITSPDEGVMDVALMEGSGKVEVNGGLHILVPGSETTVTFQPESDNPIEASEPQSIQTEKYGVVRRVLAAMPRNVELPEPATRRELSDAAERSRRRNNNRANKDNKDDRGNGNGQVNGNAGGNRGGNGGGGNQGGNGNGNGQGGGKK